jgi:hypothetical protein
MPGCAKIRFNNKLTLIVAGGEGAGSGKLKSVEMITIDLKNLTLSSTNWTFLPDLNSARSHFPTVGIINNSLIVAGGKFDHWDKLAVEKLEDFDQKRWIVDPDLTLNMTRLAHSTIEVPKTWCTNSTNRVYFPDEE